MTTTDTAFLTSGDIAERLGRDVAQVRHVLASRPDIRPVARAGLTRLYPMAVVSRVAMELAEIDARRERRAAKVQPA